MDYSVTAVFPQRRTPVKCSPRQVNRNRIHKVRLSKILVVEDDRTLLELLQYNLVRHDHDVVTATTGIQALELARNEKPDLVILDLMLPELDGYDVCRFLRRDSSVPILILTARTEEMDKVMGLELGADDYVTKPFSLKELFARVRALLRRSQATPATKVIRAGNLEIDLASREVTGPTGIITLPLKEFELLALLASNKGVVFSRNQLLEKIWGYEYEGDTRTVDVHIRWLRQRIEEEPNHPRHLITVRGLGYKFVE
jgi:DNA-binding response OmpR family regulator